jgi:sugar phosphate isomerase/epimerase
MKPLTRRTFVKGSLLCSAAAAFAAPDNGPRAVFPTEPRARIGVATYPFRRMITAPGNKDIDPKKTGMDLAAFARYIPKEFGVHGIEPLSDHFPSTEIGAVRKLRAAFDAAGVRVVNIPVEDQPDVCSNDEAKRNAGNARFRHWIDIAVILGSPGIRIWIPNCSDTADLPKAVWALKPTIDYAASRNIAISLENDDPVYASAPRTLAVLKLANSPFLRALPDFGNGLVGGDTRFNADGVKHMFAYAWSIAHVKDAEFVKGKHKTVSSLAELFGFAKAAGFRGYYSMESDSDADPVVDTKRLIEQSLLLM